MDAAKKEAPGEAGRGLGAEAHETAAKQAHGGNDAAARVASAPLFSAFKPYRGCRLELIPLKWHDKAPADSRWQSRTYDQHEVLERARRQELNLGVRLPDDVVVIDVDPRNFCEGVDSLAKFVEATGLDLALAPHVLTGNLDNRGHHYYFRKPLGTKLEESIEGFNGIEFKSSRRQVVAAGSVHPTGGLYEWAPDSPPLHEMPDLPDRVVEMARRPERKQSAGVGAGEITPDQLAKALERFKPEDFSEHSKWLELMMACHHATDGEGRQEFIDWSTSDPEYLDHAWLIGRRWDSLHADRDEGVTIATLRKLLHEVGADIPHPDPEHEFEVWEEEQSVLEERPRRFITIEELERLPPPRWLIPGVLTETSLAAVYGQPEAGKSFLAVDFAMSVAGGVDWHGRPVEAGGVLYIAAEGAPGLAKRVRAWKQAQGAQGRNFAFALDYHEVNLAADSVAARSYVTQVAEELGSLKLIVIDTLNQTSAGADENSAKDMGRYIASMKRLRDETGATVLVIHHSGKDVGRGMRGSNAILGAMDTTMEVERDKDKRAITVSVRKQKDSEAEPPMRFMLEQVVLPGDVDVMGKPPSSLVLRPALIADPTDDFDKVPRSSDGLIALACELGASAGTLKVAELVAAAVDRLGMSDSGARREIAEQIAEGSGEASLASWDGRNYRVWRERMGKHRTAPLIVRVEAQT